ncbi:MAG: ribosome biogenesis GTP-binding protein YihA/YsxC [Raoultibacter sp.]
MNYNNAKYEASYGTAEQLLPSEHPEVAFAGRSNVGKSSLLNKLFNRKALARVSSVPGKTSTINFFSVDDVDFVDLPGYGYAKVAKTEKSRWMELIDGYFNQERSFALVVSLIDIRHPATDLDIHMIDFLSASDVPFIIVLTKADKLSNMQRGKQVAALKKQLRLPADQVMIPCSAENGIGIEELRKKIEEAIS